MYKKSLEFLGGGANYETFCTLLYVTNTVEERRMGGGGCTPDMTKESRHDGKNSVIKLSVC